MGKSHAIFIYYVLKSMYISYIIFVQVKLVYVYL